MFFGWNRSKAEEVALGERRVEQETLKRWQNIAAQTLSSVGVTEFGSARDVASWPAQDEITIPKTKTIELTNLAEVESATTLDLDEPICQDTPPAPTPVPPSDLSLNIDEDLKRRFGTNIRSALGSGTVIEGTFRFDSPVCIDGTLIGEVSSTSVLIVGEQANVRARIKVGSLIVMGTVNGDIDANELVEIRSTGHLEGDILTKRLALEEGGWFLGTCNMLD
jgi:cytoskeletal protein CcmA (bactofilin family)